MIIALAVNLLIASAKGWLAQRDHELLVTADVAVDGAVPGGDVTRLVNRLRGRLRTEPGITEAYLTPVPHLLPAPQPLES